MKTILIIEDNTILRKGMRQIFLLDQDYVLESDNVNDAIALLRSEEIDLVISDVVLPDHSGITLLKYIREQHLVPDLPFIIF